MDSNQTLLMPVLEPADNYLLIANNPIGSLWPDTHCIIADLWVRSSRYHTTTTLQPPDSHVS